MRCISKKVDENKQSCYTSFYEIDIGKMNMTTAQICKDLIERSTLQQKDIAERLGLTQQNVSNKIRRNRLYAEEFKKIIEMLGYEIKIVKTETKDEIKTRRKGVGKRLRMMVNGVKYDTFKSDAICHSNESEDMFCELYQDAEGRYFVAQYVQWDGGVSSISPISKEDAEKLIKKLS